jgi:hypothetical protein
MSRAPTAGILYMRLLCIANYRIRSAQPCEAKACLEAVKLGLHLKVGFEVHGIACQRTFTNQTRLKAKTVRSLDH